MSEIALAISRSDVSPPWEDFASSVTRSSHHSRVVMTATFTVVITKTANPTKEGQCRQGRQGMFY